MSELPSDRSTHLDLPYIQPAQAQKHVTHNEALRLLDAVVQLSVISRTTATPPAAPGPGARYLLPAGATGAWAGQEPGTLALHDDGAWQFIAPQTGWRAWIAEEGRMAVHDGTGWAVPDLQNLDLLGVNTTADATNRLAVASEATLLTHAGAGHQLKLNKSGATDTASLLFQTGWSGRAEMGTAGSDDFAIKVSPDGSTFHTALVAEAGSGAVSFPNGASGLSPVEFGAGPLATTGYIAARGTDLVTNGSGLLGNGYNFPTTFTFDAATTPNLPGAVSLAGHYPGILNMTEALAVDPNKVYRLSCYLRQEDLPGDWSGFANGCRHSQYMGLSCRDADGQEILAQHHMRYRQGGVDSRTVLAAPLAPGDTVIQLADASGWNDSAAQDYNRGVIVFGYRNSAGALYEDYSRIVAFDLFDLGQVDKTAQTVTLKTPWPATMANPDDPSGVWPAGTPLANSSRGGVYKYAFFAGLYAPEADRWYRTENHIGGIDRSGTNAGQNFAPGTAYVVPLWLPNYSNRPGGWSGHPDTGTAQRIWFAGISVTEAALALTTPVASGPVSGSADLQVARADGGTGTITLTPPTLQVTLV